MDPVSEQSGYVFWLVKVLVGVGIGVFLLWYFEVFDFKVLLDKKEEKADVKQENKQVELQAPDVKEPSVEPSAWDANKSSGPGWCYVGEEDGYRSCAPVGASDTCMSNQVYPSQDICINPNLRQ